MKPLRSNNFIKAAAILILLSGLTWLVLIVNNAIVLDTIQSDLRDLRDIKSDKETDRIHYEQNKLRIDSLRLHGLDSIALTLLDSLIKEGPFYKEIYLIQKGEVLFDQEQYHYNENLTSFLNKKYYLKE